VRGKRFVTIAAAMRARPRLDGLAVFALILLAIAAHDDASDEFIPE